jgi:hypothetical protein
MTPPKPLSRLRLLSAIILAIALCGFVRPAAAYSVLAHEALVDVVWDQSIEPLLRQRFPKASGEQIRAARAFAYGGSVIQDLGYYPFGSKEFTNLVHYVRAGDFVEAMIRDAKSVDEYAFALGALAHYASDTSGHRIAVNRAVPMLYPKMRQKFGDEVIYVQSPARHVMVEFAFDVLQIAGAGYDVQAYRDHIGFEVADALLDRAFFRTYGLQLHDLFGNIHLAIGTYRHAISTTIPQMTQLAWEEKQDEIRKRTPDITREHFLFALTPRQYVEAYGTDYRKPGIVARVGYFFFKLLPKIGPLRPLAFEPLTPQAERLFVQSFEEAQERYRSWLRTLALGPLMLENADLDTGEPPDPFKNALLDKTYANLQKMIVKGKLIPPPALAQVIRAHVAGTDRAGVTRTN